MSISFTPSFFSFIRALTVLCAITRTIPTYRVHKASVHVCALLFGSTYQPACIATRPLPPPIKSMDPSTYRRLHKIPHPCDNIFGGTKVITRVWYSVGGVISYVTCVIKCAHGTPPTGGVITKGCDKQWGVITSPV